PRHPTLRQRRRSVGGREQVSRHTCRALPRHVLGASRRRGRRDECPLPRCTRGWPRARGGARAFVSAGAVLRSRAPRSPAGKDLLVREALRRALSRLLCPTQSRTAYRPAPTVNPTKTVRPGAGSYAFAVAGVPAALTA